MHDRTKNVFSIIFGVFFVLLTILIAAADGEANPQNRFTYSFTTSGSTLTVTINYTQESFDGLDATLYQPRILELWPQWNNTELELTGIALGQAAILAEKDLTQTTRVTPEDAQWSEARAIIMNTANTNRVAPGKALILTFNVLKNPSSTLKWRVDRSSIAPEEANAYLILEEKTLSVPPPLYAAFTNYGLYKYEGNAWSKINSVNPNIMTTSGGVLYADFANYGLYKYAEGAWTEINKVHPTSMLSSDGKLYATFAGYGFYQYDGTNWSPINTVNPDKMTTSGGVLYADFANYGLYKYAGGAWTEINKVHPTNMLSSDGKLYATFTGYGFYQYDNATGWKLINSVNPESMTVSGGILYPVFKDYGFYKYDGATWTQINSVIPNKVVAGE